MIFFSYSNKDFKVVLQIYSELIKSINKDIWFAPEQISFGDSWEAEIKKGLKSSDIIMLFLSQHRIFPELNSNLSKEDRMITEALNKDSNKKVILIGIDKTENPFKDIALDDQFNLALDINEDRIIDLENSKTFKSLKSYLNPPKLGLLN